MAVDKLTAMKHLQQHFQLSTAEALELVGPTHPRGLRDEFAGRALTGAVGGWVRTPKEAARLAYDFADAMLEARNANR